MRRWLLFFLAPVGKRTGDRRLASPPRSSERLSRECVEPDIGSAMEIGREHTTQEYIFVRVDCYLVLVFTHVLDGVGGFRIALETRHHELLREAVRSDLLRKRRVEGV